MAKPAFIEVSALSSGDGLVYIHKVYPSGRREAFTVPWWKAAWLCVWWTLRNIRIEVGEEQ